MIWPLMHRCLFLVIALTSTACRGDENRPAPVSSEPSDIPGDVPVVSMPSDAAVPSWSVSEDATVSLGGLDAGANYQLYQAEFALRLRDGRIVVANQGTLELRFYGADGSHLETVGRRGDGRVYVGKDCTGDIRVYRLDGTPLHVIRTGLPTHPVTPARILAYRKRALSDVESDRLPEERHRLEQIPAAERTPAFTRLFADRLGRVWVEPFTEGDKVPRTWTIYDNAGKALARIPLPARARPVDAGENYVLLHSHDDLDVERLSLHSLHQP